MLGKSVDLLPQFGDRCGLPQAALARGPNGIERLRSSPIAADESAVLGDVEAKKKRIRARQPPCKQGRHERIFQAPAIALGPGAVDDPIDFQRAGVATLAFAAGDLDRVVVLYTMNDSACTLICPVEICSAIDCAIWGAARWRCTSQ